MPPYSNNIGFLWSGGVCTSRYNSQVLGVWIKRRRHVYGLVFVLEPSKYLFLLKQVAIATGNKPKIDP